jgi:integrase
MRFLAADQVGRLADEIGEQHRAFVLLAAFCGLRAGEMLALRWERVHLLERRIEIVEQTDPSGALGAVKPPKSAAGRRSISLPQFVVDALAAHGSLGVVDGSPQGQTLHVVTDSLLESVKRAPLTGLVFTAAGGGPIDLHNFRARVWAPAVERAGFDGLRIHDLRHTCASLAISTGASVKVIQRMLGHASAAMTLDRYGHLMPSESEAVAERLDALMRPAV